MKIVVTGASGFLGKPLVRRILAEGGLGSGLPPFERLTLVGRTIPSPADDKRIRIVKGDIRDPGTREAGLDGGVDCLFHLAGALINRSEPDYDFGRSVNLDASLALFETLRGRSVPCVVFASTIAVYGTTKHTIVDDDTLPQPTLSYGTHKLMVEHYLNDVTRRGFLDARAVRIAATVPRPRLPDRTFSPAFGSNIFHALSRGERFDSPVSPAASMWLSSLECCVDNLLHAARLSADRLPPQRAWLLPALHTTMGELFEALIARCGEQARTLVTWNPIPQMEAELGTKPPLKTPLADSLGFRHDGTVEALVDRTLKVLRSVAA